MVLSYYPLNSRLGFTNILSQMYEPNSDFTEIESVLNLILYIFAN